MARRSRALIVAVLLTALVTAGVVEPASRVMAADEPVYYLPAPAGAPLVVRQGNAEPTFRSEDEDYAFDLAAAEGRQRFTVVAARGGTVIGVRSGIRGGRCLGAGGDARPSCWRQVNLILIDHGDGTSGLYLHLRPGRAPVSSGDVVSRGQPIGVAANSGWTDAIGVQFQVQRTPAWNERGRGGWFLTESLPVSFADEDVRRQHPDGVPQAEDTVVSGNPGPIREPFRMRRRPVGLPATVPIGIDAEASLSDAYVADSPDGYGLHFAPGGAQAPADAQAAAGSAATPGVVDGAPSDPGIIVRPLFGGELAFAGCAGGASASLGRMVAIRLDLSDGEYTAVLGHLSEIEPTILGLDPAAAPLIIGPNEYLGRYGAILPPGVEPALKCPAADPSAGELFAAILRDATVTRDGQITGGTPVSPEPLVGELAYEGLAWWSGPLTASAVAEEPGRPRARWNRRTPEHTTHVTYGDPIPLVARVLDVTDIAEVRFRAWYPAWPRTAASRRLDSFDPTTAWRQLARCTPPGEDSDPSASDCRWNGSRRDAIVTWQWDPASAPPGLSAPWLPRARSATSPTTSGCVPVSLAVEVVDTGGHVFSEIGRLPLPGTCDDRVAERDRDAHLLYLDPLVPPRAPTPRGVVEDRGWPPVYEPDPLDGAIVWRDRSDNEDGFNIYARRSWFEVDCSVTDGPWQLVTTLPPDSRRYRPQHTRVGRSIEVPLIEGVPGSLDRWEYAVSAFNEAGETRRLPVGGFVGGSEAFCDRGLEPPPDAESVP